jgi:hypothetical protein
MDLHFYAYHIKKFLHPDDRSAKAFLPVAETAFAHIWYPPGT